MFKIAPSILAADFLHLEKDIELVNRCGDILHLDVMDGTLVPNISFGFSVIDQLKKIATAPMDAHLMVVHPERWFSKLADDGVQMCSFHYEAAGRNTSKFIGQIQALGMKAGVVINPDVPVEKLFPYIGKADYFLLMSVFAGFGGQKFIIESLDRAARLKKEIV
ncbi:MAG TPA: ribulose-phosphate 3-epimerase, partial [Rikenellaceae bacterium]|nr:ribulose-phosphate 3-epimerase [Rikenellaceae bacterium]